MSAVGGLRHAVAAGTSTRRGKLDSARKEIMMPKILFTENLQGCKAAAVQFHTGSWDEEIHLLYSIGREHGPGIIRDGSGPPRMARIHKPWETTTTPMLQRMGAWFVNEELKSSFLNSRKLQEALNKEKVRASDNPKELEALEAEWKSLEQELRNTNSYKSYFTKASRDRVVGLQSFGDLTMNLWRVAFVRLLDKSQPPKLIYLENEPVNNRIYSCIVKWKENNRLRKKQVTIELIRFSSFIYDQEPNHKEVVRLADEAAEPIADQIEFAASGQLLIRDGSPVKLQEIVHQFSDIRHLVALPNLNPNGPLYKDDGPPSITLDDRRLDDNKSRYYFGKEQRDDVWFGESQLLRDRNLRLAALYGMIELNRLESGASESQIEATLQFRTIRTGSGTEAKQLYKKGNNPPNPLNQGEWRFVMEDNSRIEVWLKPNIYPSNILGVTTEGDVISFAWRGTYMEPPGYTIIQDITTGNAVEVESAVTKMLRETRNIRLRDAILLDEGSDVRLEAIDEDDSKRSSELVADASREQVRALFLFSSKQTSARSLFSQK
jgi:hypothetical protein